jgi:hypothetical protein
MIVLRCTSKLLARVGPAVADPPPSTARLGDWYAKPFSVAQRRFVVVLSGPSRLPVFLPLRGAADLPRTFADALRPVLLGLGPGLAQDAIEREVAESRPAVVARTDSKSVLGSVNEAAFIAQHVLRSEPDVDLVRLAVEVANMPIVAGNFGFPVDVVARLLGGGSLLDNPESHR